MTPLSPSFIAAARNRVCQILSFLALLFAAGCKEAAPPQARTESKAATATGAAVSATATGAAVNTVNTVNAVNEASATEGNPLEKYFKRLKADAFNPRMDDPAFAALKPRRGGELRARTPAAFGTLNPVLISAAPDREVANYLFDSLIRQDYETLEFKPRLAWSWEDRDVVVEKEGGRKTGVIVGRDEKSIRFVEGASRRTFLKNDLASFAAGPGGSAKLKEKWGAGEFRGHITEFEYTIKVDTSTAPDATAAEIPFDRLATYEVSLGEKTETRPAAKPSCCFRFFIRPNLKWSDGEPLTADDWIFTLDAIRNPNIKDAANLRNYYADLEEYRSVDDGLTLEYLWTKPYFLALQFSGGEDLFPIPRHVFKPEQYAGDPVGFADSFVKNEFARKPIGCGPYNLAEWTSDRLALVRNPLHFAAEADLPYFTKDQPYLDKITWLLIENRTVALKEMQKGSVDYDGDVEPDTWVSAEANTGEFKKRLVRAERTGLLYTYIGWNLERPWFKDARVRKALAMLVPADRIAKDIHFGLARRVSQPFFIDGPVYDPSIEALPYDPQAAKRLLREAGWLDRNGDGVLENEVEIQEDGKTVRKTIDFEFEYLIHTAKAYHEQIANIVKEEFGKAGIKVNVRPLDFATFLKGILDGNFDACRLAWGTIIDGDPFQVWHSSQAVKGGSNHIGYRNKRVDEIMEHAREEFDPIKRWTMYREMSRIVAEDQPMCFLFAFPHQYFYSVKFRGVKLYPTEYPVDLTEWWIADDSR